MNPPLHQPLCNCSAGEAVMLINGTTLWGFPPIWSTLGWWPSRALWGTGWYFNLSRSISEIIVTNIYDTFHLQAEMHPDRDQVRAVVITGAHVCNLPMQICQAAREAGHKNSRFTKWFQLDISADTLWSKASKYVHTSDWNSHFQIFPTIRGFLAPCYKIFSRC